MRSGRGAATAALAVLGWLATAGVAAAHDDLVSSRPADGQALPSSPELVELEFAGPPETLGAGPAVVVTAAGEAAAVVSVGAVQVDGATVRQPLQAALPDGEYVVAYRVVSADGHEVEGSTRFFVGAVPAAAPAEVETQPADEPGPGLPVPLLAAVGAAAAVLGAAAVVRRSRQRTEGSA